MLVYRSNRTRKLQAVGILGISVRLIGYDEMDIKGGDVRRLRDISLRYAR